jgi:hypothetical protein
VRVIHALQVAKYAAENLRDPLLVDIISNIVATHHSKLFDNIMRVKQHYLKKSASTMKSCIIKKL